MRRETEFLEILRKSTREKKVEWCDWEGEKMNFGNDIIEIHSTVQPLPVKCSSGSARIRFSNCGNQVGKIVRNWEERKYELWQPSCQKWKKKKFVVVEIYGGIKKNSVTSIIFLQQITGD